MSVQRKDGLASVCPTCGQSVAPVSVEKRAAELLFLLGLGDRRRDVYLGRDGSWYITYLAMAGNYRPFSDSVIYALAESGKLVRSYPESDASYCVPPSPYYALPSLQQEGDSRS